MKHSKTVITILLVAVISLGCTCVFASENVKDTRDTESTKSVRNHSRFAGPVSEEEKAERQEAIAAALSEKLEAGEITQEQYDKIVGIMESVQSNGVFGRTNGKLAFAEKETATLEEKLEAGEITQEQYDKIVAAKESDEWKGMGGRGHGKFPGNSKIAEDGDAEATDEQTTGRPQNAFGKSRSMSGRQNGRAWHQSTEKNAE